MYSIRAGPTCACCTTINKPAVVHFGIEIPRQGELFKIAGSRVTAFDSQFTAHCLPFTAIRSVILKLDGVFLLACDLPLVSSDLVGNIIRNWPAEALAVAPGSRGPLGFEPLCSAFSVAGLPRLEELRKLESGEDLFGPDGDEEIESIGEDPSIE